MSWNNHSVGHEHRSAPIFDFKWYAMQNPSYLYLNRHKASVFAFLFFALQKKPKHMKFCWWFQSFCQFVLGWPQTLWFCESKILLSTLFLVRGSKHSCNLTSCASFRNAKKYTWKIKEIDFFFSLANPAVWTEMFWTFSFIFWSSASCAARASF